MSRPWFPFYVGDYIKDTARLTTEAHGAYLLLMLDYWVNGAPPDDDEVLATITKLPINIWKKRRPSLVKFFKVADGVWTHSRIEKEKAKAEEVGNSNSDKAREAAERRWSKEREKKLREQSEQCSLDAPSITQAVPQNAQSQSQSQVDDIGSAGAFTAGSKALTEAFWKALGFESHMQIPPEFSGVDWRAIEWERAGWTVDLITTHAKKLASYKPLKPLSYFEKVFATAYARLNAPLPVVVIQPQEKTNVTPVQRGGIGSALDKLIERAEAAEGDDGRGPGGGQATAGLLSHR